MEKLTDRLQLIADEIEKGETMADIGTDHGFLPLYLWKMGISPHVIMCDISEPSLAKAKGTAGSFLMNDNLDFRAGDGLKVLKDGETDAVVIAGMGGLLIRNILAADISKSKSFDKYVLQPRNNSGHLRYWLVSNGYEISKNQLVREGKFICEIITAKPNKCSQTANICLREDLVDKGSAYWEIPIELLDTQPKLSVEYAKIKLDIDKKILTGLKLGNTVDKEQVNIVVKRIEYWHKLLTAKTENTIKCKKGNNMKYNEIIDLIEEIAPSKEYKEIDNSGEQINMGKAEIKKVLVCLEINMDIIQEAVKKNVDLIITHHPLIFYPESVINYNDYPDRYILELIKNNISVYSAHLSFDFAPKGNNFYLSQLLNLFVNNEGSMKAGYRGQLPEPMTFDQACRHVEDALNLPDNYIRCVDSGKEKIVNVGFCTGAGGDYLFEAAKNGCDLFITGDLKLHEAQYAKAMGMSVIDAGHYGTEKIFSENIAHQLYVIAADKGLDIDVIIAEANTNPYII